MPIWSLTQERVEKLRRQIGDKEVEIDVLIKLTKEDIWKRDLDEFINEWRFQLEDEDRRQRKAAGLGRRVSAKLATGGGRGAASRKRKANGDDSDEDFGAPKSKKKAAAKKKEQPTNSLMNFLNKSSTKSAPAAVDGSDEDDFDFDMEVLPKKSRGAAKPKPKEEAVDVDMEEVPAKPAADPMDMDDDVEETRPKPAAKRGAKPKQKVEEDSDDDFLEIAKSEASKPATSRARKPAKYTAPSDSDSENGDDLLADVGQMVKGIGGDANAESRQFFSEKSRPGSSASLKPTSKVSKSQDLEDDETDYSKLIPQNSPRRSLQVKSKDVMTTPDEDEDEGDEPAKPASKAKAKAAPKSKAAAAAPKARGRPKKDAAPAKPAATSASSGLSAAAKAYASKQAKTAATKKNIVDDFSEDDIDAMANDILDSPAGKIDVDDDDDEPPPRRAAASRPSRRTATTKKSYTVAADSDDDDDASADDFDDDESE
jgi:DNA topoisomerase-2